MALQIAVTQHVGSDRHKHGQQDALWAGGAVIQSGDLVPEQRDEAAAVVTVAVADGVTNSPHADRASRLVLEVFAVEVQSGAILDGRLIRRVHGRLCDRLARGATFGAATTLAAAQFRDGRLIVLNVGDSRVYRISANGTWQQLSRDHTLLNAMIDRGEADPNVEYARMYQMLDACLVADDDETDFAVHRAECEPSPGDAFLVCTDGVHGVLTDSRLRRLTDRRLAPSAQLRKWRKAVLAAGAPDNFSAILVQPLALTQ